MRFGRTMCFFLELSIIIFVFKNRRRFCRVDAKSLFLFLLQLKQPTHVRQEKPKMKDGRSSGGIISYII